MKKNVQKLLNLVIEVKSANTTTQEIVHSYILTALFLQNL